MDASEFAVTISVDSHEHELTACSYAFHHDHVCQSFPELTKISSLQDKYWETTPPCLISLLIQ